MTSYMTKTAAKAAFDRRKRALWLAQLQNTSGNITLDVHEDELEDYYRCTGRVHNDYDILEDAAMNDLLEYLRSEDLLDGKEVNL